MAWFFTDESITGNSYIIKGEDARHIEKSLRMKKGEPLTLCDKTALRYDCVIEDFLSDGVQVKIVNCAVCEQEPDVKITLFMALCKGDKMDDIIQKSVELGVYEIVPVLSDRCISRPDEKNLAKKRVRWQKIADNAARQSRRGIIPQVLDCMELEQAAIKAAELDKSLVFYECGGKRVKELIENSDKSVGIFVGSEGGFEQSEIDMLEQNGAHAATLGKRILRAQTAPLAALALIMYQTDNLG